MGLFKKKNKKRGFFQIIEETLNRLGLLKRESFYERHAIHFLNGAQFLGVVNDNFFKYLIVFLFIDLKGIEASPVILTGVGIVYVLPFLIFSSGAGVLADKFSKQKMIILLKFTEVVIMALGVVAFLFKSDWASYTLLFLLSMQSAVFGPPKYSIIPELVKEDRISKANGLITSSTYLGIIVGTFLASFLTQITHKNFPLTAGIGTVLALLGFIASIFIPKTAPKQSKKRVNPLFFYEIYRNLVYAARRPSLLAAISGSASFLFIGAYFQLNVIPYAMESMGYTEVAGGYLFLLTAVGIATGALLAGKLCKTAPEIGLACISGIIVAVILLLLGLFSHCHTLIFTSLFGLGLFGGLYIVPFDSFVQRFAPHQRRGQIVAASNFLSFCGVLIAPLLLFFFSEVLGLSAAQGFIATGLMILAIVLAITSRLPGFFFNYLARIFIKPFYRVEPHDFLLERKRPFLLVFKEMSLVHIALLATFNPRLYFYVFRKKRSGIRVLLSLFFPIDFINIKKLQGQPFQTRLMQIKTGREAIPCLCFPSGAEVEETVCSNALETLKKTHKLDLLFVDINQPPPRHPIKRSLFKQMHVSFTLSKDL